MKRDRREYMKKWHLIHKQHDIQYKKENKEKLSLYNKTYKEKHKEQISLSGKIYRQNNRKKEALRQLKWRKANPDKYKKLQLGYSYKKHLYYIKNKKRILLNNHKRKQYRLKNDPLFKLRENLRHRIYLAIKNNHESSLVLLGCSINKYWKYLQSKFKSGMTIENYGKIWNIDHIKPCCSFDLSNKLEQQKCFHYTNTQPLFIKENLKKGGKII